MRSFSFYKKRTIYCSLIGIIVLQFFFSCIIKFYFQPSWNMLILIFWVLQSPRQVNIGTAFFFGLITDCIFNSVLGINAFSFSIISYLIIRNLYFLQNVSVLQQSFFITCFSLINQICKLLAIFLITKIFATPEIFWNCILDGVLWPILLFLMRKVYAQ